MMLLCIVVGLMIGWPLCGGANPRRHDRARNRLISGAALPVQVVIARTLVTPWSSTHRRDRCGDVLLAALAAAVASAVGATIAARRLAMLACSACACWDQRDARRHEQCGLTW
jgi:hypothetical protein